jgi:hypothetical protein
MSKKKQPMLPETKSKILGVMKESFASLGFPTLLDGAEKFSKTMKGLVTILLRALCRSLKVQRVSILKQQKNQRQKS